MENKNKSKFREDCPFKTFLLLMIVSFPITYILYKCQISFYETGENTLNI